MGQDEGTSGIEPRPTPLEFPPEDGKTSRQLRAERDLALGVILLVIGLAITAFTFSLASRGVGTYLVSYGPMLFGGARVARGLARR
jgi:hypothetical protein